MYKITYTLGEVGYTLAIQDGVGIEEKLMLHLKSIYVPATCWNPSGLIVGGVREAKAGRSNWHRWVDLDNPCVELEKRYPKAENFMDELREL